MAKSDYVPKGDDAFVKWHDQFLREVTANGTSVGVTADELTDLGADNTALHNKTNAAVTATAAALRANGERATTRKSVERNARALGQRIRKNKNCTEEIAKQMGLVGEEDTTDMTVAQPVLVANPLPHGAVEIAFNKSKADGVNLYCQRDGDSGFVFLARDTASPYVDNRPLLVAGKPEVRKYRGIYVVNDAEVGLVSDDVTAVCQP